MKLQLCKAQAFAANSLNNKGQLISSLEIEFLQITLKLMQHIDPRKEARRMVNRFLIPQIINLSSPPICPMVESIRYAKQKQNILV